MTPRVAGRERAALRVPRRGPTILSPRPRQRADRAVEAPRARARRLTLARAEAGPPEQALGLLATERSGVDGGAHPWCIVSAFALRVLDPARGIRGPVDEERYIGRRNVAKRLTGVGPGRTVYAGGSARFELDGLTVTVTPPFGLEHEREYERVAPEPLLEALEADRVVAALLVRLGGFAVGVYEGERLVDSKVGSRFVKGAAQEGRLIVRPVPAATRGAGARARPEGGRRGRAHPHAVAREGRARGSRRRPRRRPARARRACRPRLARAARARALLHGPGPAAAGTGGAPYQLYAARVVEDPPPPIRA